MVFYGVRVDIVALITDLVHEEERKESNWAMPTMYCSPQPCCLRLGLAALVFFRSSVPLYSVASVSRALTIMSHPLLFTILHAQA